MSCKDLKAGELVPRTTILPPSPTRPHPHAPVMAFVFVPPLDGEFPESRASFLHAPPPHPRLNTHSKSRCHFPSKCWVLDPLLGLELCNEGSWWSDFSDLPF